MRRIMVLFMFLTFALYGCYPNVIFDSQGATLKIDLDDDSNIELVGEKVTTDKDKKVTLRMIDWSDSTKARRTEFNKQFMERYPNVSIEYTTLTIDQFNETIISSIKAGNAPDIFPIPSGVRLRESIRDKWFIPLDTYMPQDFLETFDDGSFNEGITSLGGNIYLLPESANIITTLMFYNKDILDKTGVSLPKTWDEFIDACEYISDYGDGEYYGIISSGAQTNRMELELRSFASLAGAGVGDIGQIIMDDGRNLINSVGMQAALGLYDSLTKVGGFHPDSTLLRAQEARAIFAQGQAAFIIQGAWCISTWRDENPNLNFGVMPLPIPDNGQEGKLPYLASRGWIGISSDCEAPDIAAMYLMELYSYEYQSILVSDGGFVSSIIGVNESSMTDEVMRDYYNIHKNEAVLAPDPIISNPYASYVYAEVNPVSPGIGEIVQGVLSESIDYRSELNLLSELTQAEWDSAINTVIGGGGNIDTSSFEFSDWDKMKDYDMAIYYD